MRLSNPPAPHQITIKNSPTPGAISQVQTGPSVLRESGSEANRIVFKPVKDPAPTAHWTGK